MKVLLWLWLGMSLWACSRGDVSGTTSETENQVSLRIVQEGAPVAFAKVYLIDGGNYDSLLSMGASVRLDSAWSDAEGRATLAYHGVARIIHVLVQKADHAAFLANVTDGDSLIALEPVSTIVGQLQAAENSRVVLYGTDFSSRADAGGRYTIQGVPRGRYALVVQGTEGAAVMAGSVFVDSATEIESDIQANGFLLDDFDDGDSLPLLGLLGAGAPWYTYADGAGTLFEPQGVADDIRLGIAGKNAWTGKSLGLSIVLDSSVTAAYGSLACKLGSDGGMGRANFSGLDSIAFYVKGSGQLRVALASDYIHTHYGEDQAYADLGYRFQAPANWTRVVIPVDSLRPPDGSLPANDGVRWSDVADAIDLFVVGSWDNAGTTVDFQIDDIRLYGITTTSFH